MSLFTDVSNIYQSFIFWKQIIDKTDCWLWIVLRLTYLFSSILNLISKEWYSKKASAIWYSCGYCPIYITKKIFLWVNNVNRWLVMCFLSLGSRSSPFSYYVHSKYVQYNQGIESCKIRWCFFYASTTKRIPVNIHVNSFPLLIEIFLLGIIPL